MNLTRYEIKWWREKRMIVGVDESGVGSLAGPVVGAAVVLEPNTILPGINDSKKLSPTKRRTLYTQIVDVALAWSVCAYDAEQVDEMNIYHASPAACHEAVMNVIGMGVGEHVLMDGNRELPPIKDSRGHVIKQTAIPQGDGKSISIAAASILAKVTRDNWMITVAEKLYPGYSFKDHKGYWNPKHLEAIAKLGACPIHRMSFKPFRGKNICTDCKRIVPQPLFPCQCGGKRSATG